MSKWLMAGLLWACLGSSALAARPTVAVFDIQGAGLSRGDADKLTTYLGTELAATGVYRVVPREQLRGRLTGLRKRSYEARFAQAQQIAIGKELAAQKSLATRVMRVGRRCVITSTLWDIGSASSERAAVVKSRCAPDALMDSLGVVSAKLTASMDRVIAHLDRRLASGRGAAFPARYRDDVTDGERTGAPFFYIPGARSGESLPLKSTSAEVNVVGVVARVTVKQTYRNRGDKPIEAVYVFPGSTRAAIHGMRMKIGERIVEAEIKTRRAARETYEHAKRDGKRASLLEQQRSSVFMMSVANIMPHEEIGIELVYSELLEPEDGVYEVVYPAVVGPRYGGADSSGHGWADNPHLARGQAEPYAFDFVLHLQSAIGIKALSSPSHKIKTAYHSSRSATVRLDQAGGGDRDVVVRYRLAGNGVESGVLVFEDRDEKFFLAMLEPPRSVKRSDVTPREYIFVVDVSGSMNGFPLDVSKRVIRDLFRDLRPADRFNVVLFASSSRVLSPRSLVASQDNLNRAFELIDEERGGGGTELLAALSRAYQLPRPRARALSRTVVVVTDGFITAEAPVYRFVRRQLNRANLFAFGIGSSVNRGLIEMLAEAGMGRPFVVLGRNGAAEQAARFRRYIDAPVLTNIKVRFEGVEAYDVIPREVPDLLGQRPLVVFGKYRGTTSGKLTVEGYTGAGRYRRSVTLDPSSSSPRNRPLRVLWARRWADLLMTQQRMLPDDAPLEQAVTDVGLIYNIVTPFTSFVAVDSEQVNPSGAGESVRQPLPQPGEGSSYATTGEVAPTLPAAEREVPTVEARLQSGCGCTTGNAPGPDLGVLVLFLLLGAGVIGARRRGRSR